MTTPLVALDHLRIVTDDLRASAADYARILGRAPLFEGEDGGQRTAVFGTDNVHVVLAEDRDAVPGLEDACFRVDDIERFRRRLVRLDLDVEKIEAQDPLAVLRGGDALPLLRLRRPAARGLGLTFTAAGPARSEGAPRSAGTSIGTGAGVTGLDHIVVASGDALATAFLFGAQLGLDLRMDRSNPDWGARLMFFRCGDLIVEIFFALDGSAPPAAATDDAPDRFYGLSWRVSDADVARESLAAAEFDASTVRSGRKPGTRVFTLRDRTAGVATLMLQPPHGG